MGGEALDPSTCVRYHVQRAQDAEFELEDARQRLMQAERANVRMRSEHDSEVERLKSLCDEKEVSDPSNWLTTAQTF